MPSKDPYRMSKILRQFQITERRSGPYRPSVKLPLRSLAIIPIHLHGLKQARKDRETLFEFIRDTALIMLRNKLLDLLDLYRLKTMCDSNKVSLYYEETYPIFDWSVEEFYRRCENKNTIYVDVMLFNVPKQCLDVLKVKTDLNEIKKCVQLIFQNEDPYKRQSYNFGPNMQNQLRSLYDMLDLEKQLNFEIDRHTKRLKHNNFHLLFCNNVTNIKKEILRVELERQLIDMRITNPIQIRYLNKYMDGKREQHEMEAHLQEVDYYERIQNQIFMKEMSQQTTRSILDSTYTTIEVLKAKINEMTMKYEKDFDEIDNKNIYLQKRIDNFASEKRFLQFEIQRFHEEIEEQRLRDEALDRMRMEEEETKKKKKKRRHSKPRKKSVAKGEKGDKGKKKAKKGK